MTTGYSTSSATTARTIEHSNDSVESRTPRRGRMSSGSRVSRLSSTAVIRASVLYTSTQRAGGGPPVRSTVPHLHCHPARYVLLLLPVPLAVLGDSQRPIE